MNCHSATSNSHGADRQLCRRSLRIAVFIDHDIMVRHFLRSGAFVPLVEQYDVTFVFPPEGHRRLSIDVRPLVGRAKLVRLDVPVERRRIWSQLLHAKIMGPPFTRHASYIRKAWRKTMNWKAAALYTALGVPGVYAVFKLWTMAALNKRPYRALEKILDDGKFDIAINPGVPVGIYIEDLRQETRRRGIPFMHIMNSWDNPSLAVLLAGLPDYYVVWGEQTARHAVEYLKMPHDSVIKLGAAQFDVYNDTPRIDREEFCRRHDIDPSHRVLLYAGGSLGTNELEHLQLLETEIDSGRLGHTTVVYRPHPWGGGGNAGNQIIAHRWRHVRIESTMRDYLLALSERGYHMSFPDYRDTHDTLSAVDSVVSPLSTIIIEAALHGKPVMCFLPIEDRNAAHFQNVYSMPHFEDLFRDENIIVARGRTEMIKSLPTLLARKADSDFKIKIRNTCDFFIKEFDEPYGKRLRAFIEKNIAVIAHGNETKGAT